MKAPIPTKRARTDQEQSEGVKLVKQFLSDFKALPLVLGFFAAQLGILRADLVVTL